MRSARLRPALLAPLAALAALTLGSAAAAQPDSAARADSARDRGSAPLFTRRDVVFYGVLAGATAALWPFDDNIQDWIVPDPGNRNRTLDDISVELRHLNERSAAALSLIAFAAGRLSGRPRLAEAGWHSTEAVVATAAVQTVIKNAFGRSRPFVQFDSTGRHDQNDLHPGRGFKNPWYRSMPSLHTGGMLAAAVVVSDEMERWDMGSERVVRPVLYTLAIAPGVARMYDDRHWATDVLVGGAVGYWTAKKVMRYHHPPADPDRRRRIDRWMLGALDVGPASNGGMTVGMRGSF